MKAITCLFGLCLLAGAINADFAWEQGKQYKYQVRGRAMAGISGIDTQYAGLQMEYYQIITVKQPGVLNVKIEDLKVIDTNEQLKNGGWRDGQIVKGEEASIPAEMKHYITSPMDLIVKRGIVDSIRVEGDLPTWAVNMKRAMASTFNLDTIGQNQILQGNLNRKLEAQTTEEANQESGFFYKVLEQSVHGECPVYYTVSQNGPFDTPFQFVAQAQAGVGSGRQSSEELQGKRQHQNARSSSESSEESSMEKAWPRAFNQLCQQGDQVYEIIKTVNFTACAEKPVLAYTTPAGLNYRPADNAGGSLWARALVSRYIACGQSRQNYTILKITQQERFETGLRETEKVIAGAQKNVTLISISQGQAAPLQNPKTIESLVYQYDPQQQEAVKSGKLQYAPASESQSQSSEESNESKYSSAERVVRRQQQQVRRQQRQQQQAQRQQQQAGQNWNGQQLRKPTLDQAPLNTMLISPLKIEGLKSRVLTLMQEIAQGLTKTTEKDSIAEREILSKIATVVKCLRNLDRPQIEELARKLTQSGNEQQEVTRSIFLDALAMAGTNPTTVYLLDAIKAGQLNGEEAAQTLSTLPMYIRTPTKELIQKFFEILEVEAVKRQEQVRTTAMLAFSNLLFNACVDKKIKNTRYPVALYGEFCEASLVEKYLPYFIQKLEKRLESHTQQDNHWIATLLTVLGNLGHPDTIEVVQRIMDEQTDSFIKTKAIFALRNLIQSRSKLNQHQQQVQQGQRRLPIPVDRQSRDPLTDEVVEQQVLPLLVSAAFDRGEHPQVRNAAFSLLFPCTYADVAIWQQIALSTWFEQSRDVRSYVYSALKSLAELETPIQGEQWNMQRKARAVLPLAKPIDASVARSHHFFTAQFIQELNSGFAQQLGWFQGADSIVPTSFYYKNYYGFGNGAFGVHPVEVSVAGNTIQKLANAFLHAYQGEEHQDRQQQHHPELSQIKQLLNIESRLQKEPVQGAIHLKLREEVERMWTFDAETLEQFAQQIMQNANGKGELNVNYQKAALLVEQQVSMPTILGFPMVYHMRMPALISVRGTIKMNNPQGKEMSIQADLSPVYAWKLHHKLSFKVPFTGKKYQAGVQRHFVVEAPFSAVARRSPSGQIQLAITPAHLTHGAPTGTINLVTYHQIPYTAIITDEFYPTNRQQGGKMEIVHANEERKDDYHNKKYFGQNALGLAFEIEEQSEFPKQQENMSGWAKFVRKFHSANCAFNAAWLGSSSVRFAKRQIVLDLEKSETKTIVLLLAARVQRQSVARQLQSSEEQSSQESQSNSASLSQSESGSKSGSSSSSSSESEEGRKWFNIVRSPAARRQQQQQQQKKQQRKQQGIKSSSSSSSSSSQSSSSSESNSRSSSSSSESSESQSQSRESVEAGKRQQTRGQIFVVALLGKKSPLANIDELKSALQRPLQKGSSNTVQYLAQLNMKNGKLFVRLATGEAANQAAESLPQYPKAIKAIREAIKEASNTKTQVESCIEFEGTMDTPKKASRHIVAIRRQTLLAQDLSVKVQGKIQAGQNCRTMPLFVKIQGKLRRDSEMTQWAQSKSPEAKKCKKDEKKGFSISQVCMDVAERQAAALNEYKFTIEHSAMPKQVQNMTVYHVQNLLKAALYPYMSENQFPEQSSIRPGTFQVYARITPNKQFVTLEIRKPDSVLTFKNIKTGRVLKTVLPLTASQTLYGNVKDRLFRSQSDAMCAIEKNHVNTFDNVTYNFNQQAARGCQHVLAKDCSGKYPMAVLIKDLQQNKGRQVTIILGAQKIKLIPQGGESRTQPMNQKMSQSSESQEKQVSSRMTVLVNGQQHDQLPITIRNPNNKKQVVAEVMYMPNGGVQVVARRIQVATDGARVIVYGSNEFRNRTCGICGDFDNEKVADLRSPKDFPMSSGTLLVASYAFKPLSGQGQCQVDQQVQRQVRKEEQAGEQQERYIPKIHQRGQQYAAQQQERRQQQQQYRQQQQKQWFHKKPYGRVGSQESREFSESREQYYKNKQSRRQQMPYPAQQQEQQQKKQHQLPSVFRQHVAQNPQNPQELCITVNQLPACPRGYAASKTTPKTVQAHCMPKTSQHAKELKKQVQQGQHIDLARREQQPIHIESPVECISRAYRTSSESSESSEIFGRHGRLSSVQQRQDAGESHETKWEVREFKGKWGQKEFCNKNQYVYGMKLTADSESAQDSQEKRGLTGIKFLCATPFARAQKEGQVVTDARQSDKITSQKAQGGSKTEEKQVQVCPGKSFAQGVIVHGDFANKQDKSAINSIDILCSNGKTLRGDTVFQGPQKQTLECAAGRRLCGLQTEVEDLQRSSNDHYGVVNMKLYCCDKQ